MPNRTEAEEYNLKRLRDLTYAARLSWRVGFSVDNIIAECAKAVDSAAAKGIYAAEVPVRIPPDNAEEVVSEIGERLQSSYRRVLIDPEGITSAKEFTHTIYIEWAPIED